MSDTTTRDSWQDVPDAELRERLKLRGVDIYSRSVFVHYRANEHFAKQIDYILR